MSDHIPDATKMISDTPRTEAEVNRPHGPLDGIVTVDADFACMLERELNAANSKIEALNRGNANAEKILCELTGCESGRDVPDWIVKKNWELTDLSKAYLELVHKHTLTEERIKRLEEAGDVLAQRAARLGLLPMAIEGWHKAKEAKP